MKTRKTKKTHTKAARRRHAPARQSEANTGAIAANMGAAAHALGVSLGVVKLAKRLGCEAFNPRGTVDIELLERWIAQNQEAIKGSLTADLKDQKMVEEVRKLKIANDAKERTLISRKLVIEAHAKAAGEINKMLTLKLENEYPTLVQGLDVLGARVKGKQLGDSIRSEWNAIISKLPDLSK